eukprot:Phypoly_transcript_02223.p1 GENE.Phypoly_transcript_02223~~Phypoly_transcript_02223.p1  ORF type:complete len:953 (+),score=145.56 Phypoly_transcript_02223:40-2898(+)
MLQHSEQKTIIKGLIEKHKLEVGGPCYVISRPWYDSWKSYVGFDVARSKYATVKVPTAINNSNLFSEESPSSLRGLLVYSYDYEAIPVPAGKQLLEWYGGGPEIIRDVAKISISKRIEVELYPFELCFYRSSNLEEPILITTKKSITIQELKKKLAYKLGLDAKSIRLFNFQSKFKGMELGSSIMYPDPSLESSGILSGSSILIEEKDHPYDGYGTSLNEIKHITAVHSFDSPPLERRTNNPTITRTKTGQSPSKITYYDAPEKERNENRPNPLRELQDASNTNPFPKRATEKPTIDSDSYLTKQNNSAPSQTYNFPPNIYMTGDYVTQKPNYNSGSYVNSGHLSEDPMDVTPTTYKSEYTNSYSNSNNNKSYTSSWHEQKPKKGVRGLSNLGNTCYMNSALQCLARIPDFTDYFTKGIYKNEINRNNPLGMEGKIAEGFAAVLSEMWSDRAATEISPREFANTIRQFAKDQFEAGRQHDANELLAFLLDGLHEDLNRVKKKATTQNAIEQAGTPDELVAQNAWQTHLQRNNSIIVDLLQGQLKSSVSCATCKTASRNFEAFMSLSLPLQSPIVEYVLLIDVVYSDNQMPERHGILVHQDMPISALKKKVAETVRGSVTPECVYFAEVKESTFNHYFREDEKLPPQAQAAKIHAFVVLPPPKEIFDVTHSIPTTVVPVVHVHGSAPFGRPFLMSFPSCPVDFEALLVSLAVHIQRFVDLPMHSTSDTIRTMKNLISYIYQEDVKTQEQVPVQMDQPFELRAKSCLVLNWSSSEMHRFYKRSAADDIMISSSAHITMSPQKERPPANLQECLSLFSREEQLANENAWNCLTCKTSRQAIKKIEYWKLPKILVLHLKRFHFLRDQRGKIETMVEFPINGLDMSDFVVGPRGSPLIYDLFAVCNHYGSLQSGHYTAYAKLQDEWFLFDDGRATPINKSDVMTRAAYMLFYIQRDK